MSEIPAGSLGRIHAPVNEDHPYQTITPRQLEEIIRRYCRITGTAGGRFARHIDVIVRNPALSEEIAEQYCTAMILSILSRANASRDAAENINRLRRAVEDGRGDPEELADAEQDFQRRFKGRVTIADVRGVTAYLNKSLHLERWAQQKGFQATYWRAGGRYFRALAEYRRSLNASPTRAERERIWDKAALEYAWEHPEGGRYVRLSDGTSSKPSAHYLPNPKENGYARFEKYLSEFRGKLIRLGSRGVHIEWQDRSMAMAAPEPRPAEPATLDPGMFVGAGVTVEQLRHLSRESMELAGVTPGQVETLIGQLEA